MDADLFVSVIFLVQDPPVLNIARRPWRVPGAKKFKLLLDEFPFAWLPMGGRGGKGCNAVLWSEEGWVGFRE